MFSASVTSETPDLQKSFMSDLHQIRDEEEERTAEHKASAHFCIFLGRHGGTVAPPADTSSLQPLVGQQFQSPIAGVARQISWISSPA